MYYRALICFIFLSIIGSIKCGDPSRDMREVSTPTNEYSNLIGLTGNKPDDPLNHDTRDLATASSMENNNVNSLNESPYKTVTAIDSSGQTHTYSKRSTYKSSDTTVYTHDYVNNKKMRRQGVGGYRATTQLSKTNVIMEGGKEIYMTAFTMQWQSRYPTSHGVYFSDGHSIKKKGPLIGPTENSTVSEPATVLVSGVANVDIHGVNLGFSRGDVQEVRILGHQCTNIEYFNNTFLRCTTGIKEIVHYGNKIKPDDIYVLTATGGMSESSVILNYNVRQVEGYSSPIVRTVEIFKLPFSPRSLLVDPITEYIYWSDVAERSIRRSKLDGSKIELISKSPATGEVCGLSLDYYNNILYFSDANSGAIYSALLNVTETLKTQLGTVVKKRYPINKILSGLHEPRGIEINTKEQMLYFVESSGKIYVYKVSPINGGTGVGKKILLISRPSNVRVDSVTLNLNGPKPNHKLYWCEMNSNLIMEATVEGQRPKPIAGIDRSILWPRNVVHDDEKNQLYFSTFIGDIARFDSKALSKIEEPKLENVHINTGQASKDLKNDIKASLKYGGTHFMTL
jgi:hypothetical protein